MLNSRIQQINTTSLIKIIERRALTPKSSIYILEIRDREIAIAESAHGIIKLADYPVEKPSFESFLKDHHQQE